MLYSIVENGEELCEVVNVSFGIERNKINTKLYGGQYLTQTFGVGARYLNLTIRVYSQEDMQKINRAEAENRLLTVRYKGNEYDGYIEAEPRWTPVVYGEIYRASVRFLIEE